MAASVVRGDAAEYRRIENRDPRHETRDTRPGPETLEPAFLSSLYRPIGVAPPRPAGRDLGAPSSNAGQARTMFTDEDPPVCNRGTTGRRAAMTTLVPDARRGLLGGLIDDATLLTHDGSSVEQAVATYRLRRADPTGWMLGRFVVPAFRLEEVAVALARSMPRGETPWSIVAVFDRASASGVSAAAAFHALMDPAASVDVIHLSADHADSVDAIRSATAAADAIRHGVLPMARNAILGDHPDDATGRPWSGTIGAVLPVEGITRDDLVSSIHRCVRTGVPFTLTASLLPGYTTIDATSGAVRYGVLNLLAASMVAAHADETATAAVLCDADPDGYAIGFGGLVRHGESLRTGQPLATGRAPLLSIASSQPDDALTALGRLDSAR